MFTSTTVAWLPDGIGSRGNDGTDYWGLDQAFPISTNGLLFDVGTTTARVGPASAVRDLVEQRRQGYDTAFTGGVGGQEFYNLTAQRAGRARCLSPPRGPCSVLASRASASPAGSAAGPTGWRSPSNCDNGFS